MQRPELNPWPPDHESNTLATTPPSQCQELPVWVWSWINVVSELVDQLINTKLWELLCTHMMCLWQPPGDGPQLLEALVIVSQIGEESLYQQLLDKVCDCRFLSLTAAEEMIQVAYARPFPAPNKEVYIRTVVGFLFWIHHWVTLFHHVRYFLHPFSVSCTSIVNQMWFSWLVLLLLSLW